MWVEQPYASEFKRGDRIAVKYDQTKELLVGKFLKMEGTKSGYMVYFVRDDNDDELSASNHRQFYRWVDDKPVTGEDVRRIEQSKLRLNKPHIQPCWCSEDCTVAEVEAAEAHLLKRIEKLEQTVPLLKARAVIVGKQTYVLNEGDHLRVWWEDGHLYTEYVQGVEQ